MINPIGAPDRSSSGSTGRTKSQKDEIDIDKLLADLKKQGEEVLSYRQKEMKDGGHQQQDQIDQMINDIDNEFSEIDNLLKDVEGLTMAKEADIPSTEAVNDNDLDDRIQKQLQQIQDKKKNAPCDWSIPSKVQIFMPFYIFFIWVIIF